MAAFSQSNLKRKIRSDTTIYFDVGRIIIFYTLCVRPSDRMFADKYFYLMLLRRSFTDLNLNSLLVKRQIDNPSPGAVTGGN